MPEQPEPVVPTPAEPRGNDAVERLAVLLHERFRPLAGDVLIFDDCEQIARLAVSSLLWSERAAYERGKAEGRAAALREELANAEQCASSLSLLDGQGALADFYRLHAEHLRTKLAEDYAKTGGSDAA